MLGTSVLDCQVTSPALYWFLYSIYLCNLFVCYFYGCYRAQIFFNLPQFFKINIDIFLVRISTLYEHSFILSCFLCVSIHPQMYNSSSIFCLCLTSTGITLEMNVYTLHINIKMYVTHDHTQSMLKSSNRAPWLQFLHIYVYVYIYIYKYTFHF